MAKATFPLVSVPKETEFVVAVNTDGYFLAWSTAPRLTVFFVNGSGKPEPRLAPSNFAQWFIRTQGKLPDVLSWPDWAYTFWSGLHMGNMWHPEARISIPTGHSAQEFVFKGAELIGKPNKPQLVNNLNLLAIRGFYRKGNPRRRIQIKGAGPSFDDFEMFRNQIADFIRMPHMSALMQRKSEKDQQDGLGPEIHLALKDF
jgi:hypothetical protein